MPAIIKTLDDQLVSKGIVILDDQQLAGMFLPHDLSTLGSLHKSEANLKMIIRDEEYLLRRLEIPDRSSRKDYLEFEFFESR